MLLNASINLSALVFSAIFFSCAVYNNSILVSCQNKKRFLLIFSQKSCIIFKAGLDGELAVPCDLQSATAGSNARPGCNVSNMCKGVMVMKARSYATLVLEPCQALTGASLRGADRVP